MNEALIVPSSEADDAPRGLCLSDFISIVVKILARLRVELLVMVERHDT